MAIDRDHIAASYFGTEVVTSPGAWNDVAITDWDPVGSEDIPATAQIASISVTEKSTAAPCFILLRANDGEATTLAWEILSGSTEGFDCFNPDKPVTTISVYGTARLKAAFFPG